MSPSLLLAENGLPTMNGDTPHTETRREAGPGPEARSSRLRPCPTEGLHDLVCVGFGPASLAIAAALHDALARPDLLGVKVPRVAFLERQARFAWHDGMLLPDAKMQISFVKDLATLRDPCSVFTFLNYLQCQGRLVQFTNLGTFHPLRTEYDDYLRWCAAWFEDVVHYGQDVVDVLPDEPAVKHGRVESFTVRSLDCKTGLLREWRTRHVVIAVGGRPRMPDVFAEGNRDPRIIHSSAYLKALPLLLPDRTVPCRLAVVGNGQSAAEIFNDLHTRYPNSRTSLLIKGTALRPSDDSPFVNEIFDPSRVDDMYRQSSIVRDASLAADRNTNYGVVRLELLEHLYEKMYQQRLRHPHERDWQHRLLPSRVVSGVQKGKGSLWLKLQDCSGRHLDGATDAESLPVDAVIVATGYIRDVHLRMLQPTKHLLAPPVNGHERRWAVSRDYRLQMDADKVSPSAGVWLQGCNEDTHGLSDTLLSILAIRGGEMVQSVFGHPTTKTTTSADRDHLTNGFAHH
ncbi:MAG: hypothetical protein M1826_007388 [Phylliscum demangeonii]|nr:MAG: hypothetical protein M1826_007388 [Phylliscum demangeonii]